MSLLLGLVLVLAVAATVFVVGRGRASALQGAGAGRQRLNSLPNYHGGFAFIWAAVPALLFLAVWAPIQTGLVEQAVIASPAGQQLPAFDLARDSILDEARAVATGGTDLAFTPLARELVPVYSQALGKYGLIGGGFALLLAIAGGVWALSRIGVDLRARAGVERWLMGLLVAASLIAILTTFGIVLSLLFETIRFFSKVPATDFLFGLQWSPQTAIRADQAGSSGAFGSVPLFWGTVFIGAIIAMVVAIPLGLMSAIYLTQYAASRVRSVLKPLLEILAGVPTVVYGYFAALTVAPMVRDLGLAIGISSASSESALAAGLVMGVMIIPFVSSMADDSIAAVPQAMRDGSLALGATRSETIRKVILPAALPGVVGGVLLAVSRAIGETMIVVMAAGLSANLTANPFGSVTTVTTQIVQLLTGDQEFDSPKTLAAFALGLVLFLVTLFLNLIALRVVRRYREAYE
ncbi:phosphate ABC transporter permease subunit PstC [Sphingomonas astaxanthinifaciens]|uniref:Phosphate transport system permease protein n=1 Tax=Sphingomonas astaxanthinifaciens DSM 22298 TaxID=1123267 RepID=A0ABQ5ZBD2_9SPHN|nr:phosphate ABC transporter permease subunit PstC [Sphingomonas astaxanthinifaciens]GLR48168.1 phosphate transport system permease protein [Sphingomonas astaxanthinifaciens DSM 22298]